METFNFILGALSGLFLIGMVYSFLGVLKMTSRIKDLQAEIQVVDQNLYDAHRAIDANTDSLWVEIDKKINEVRQLIDKRDRDRDQEVERKFEQIYQHSDFLAQEASKKHQEAIKYTDSRIDKTIDALSTRMDVYMEDQRDPVSKPSVTRPFTPEPQYEVRNKKIVTKRNNFEEGD